MEFFFHVLQHVILGRGAAKMPERFNNQLAQNRFVGLGRFRPFGAGLLGGCGFRSAADSVLELFQQLFQFIGQMVQGLGGFGAHAQGGGKAGLFGPQCVRHRHPLFIELVDGAGDLPQLRLHGGGLAIVTPGVQPLDHLPAQLHQQARVLHITLDLSTVAHDDAPPGFDFRISRRAS